MENKFACYWKYNNSPEKESLNNSQRSKTGLCAKIVTGGWESKGKYLNPNNRCIYNLKP